MSKHKYCCQNTAQNYLNHIIPVPDEFKINPECLFGMNQNVDFIKGLKSLTEIIKKLYSDMIENPAEYGLPLVEDIEYSPFNPKAAESSHSSRRLITLLHILVQCGELSGGKIAADKKYFSEMCKNLKSVYKISNGNMILKKLCDFGFVIDGFNGKNFDKTGDTFTLSHNDKNVTPVLYGYMKINQLKNPLFALNYYLAISRDDLPADNHKIFFAEYLSGDERVFYTRLNEFMESEGFVLGNAPDYRDFAVEYLTDYKTEKRIARCYSDYGKLRVTLKLHNSGSYIEHIEKMPERVKQIFRKKSSCRYCREPCRMRLYRTFEGIPYADCGYWTGFDIVDYDLNDIEYYKQLILLETKAVKTNARKKSNKVHL